MYKACVVHEIHKCVIRLLMDDNDLTPLTPCSWGKNSDKLSCKDQHIMFTIHSFFKTPVSFYINENGQATLQLDTRPDWLTRLSPSTEADQQISCS